LLPPIALLSHHFGWVFAFAFGPILWALRARGFVTKYITDLTFTAHIVSDFHQQLTHKHEFWVFNRIWLFLRL
jgi:hypothetical protein